MRDLDRGDRRVAHPRDLRDRLWRRGEQAGDAPELLEQCLGQRLGVAARNGHGEQIFYQLVIEQPVGVGEQPLAQPRAMASIVRPPVAHDAKVIGLIGRAQLPPSAACV